MLTPERLTELTHILADETNFAQQEIDPSNPDDVSFLAEMQDVFTALRELQAWRTTYPSVIMTQRYVTPFGTQALQ